MQGTILNFSIQSNEGIITGDDGTRYTFIGAEWGETSLPTRGMRVDFDVRGSVAVGIYMALSSGQTGVGQSYSGGKNKIAAGLLAIFLGWLGIHKFYLGYNKPAIITLIIVVVGLLTAMLGVGILILIAIGVITLVEGILYLTKTDQEFEEQYVLARKHWF